LIQPTTPYISQEKSLLVTRSYPSADDLYRYPFVHRRVLGYREYNVQVDVFCIVDGEELSCYEFEGVTCHTGSIEVLGQWIEQREYEQIIVHGLSQFIWPCLEKAMETTRVIAWLHGSEIHSFHRYATMHQAAEEQTEAEVKFQLVMVFWRKLLATMPENLMLVFVSQFAANDAMQDLGMTLNPSQYTVVPNPIDTELFNYVPKPRSQRLKVLSIRPFDTTRYANDLAVQVIVALSRRSFFAQMEFCIIGDGPLFEATLAPLKGMENVTIRKGFLRQSEIADLHKDNGIFLVPTRMDTHGVSRDEAMSSGLVPVTNNVTAIPEYVDVDCGILGEAEEFQSLADGIERLVEDSGLFASMSRAAAGKVRRLTSNKLIIPREINLISGQL
jgi:glycosyltransferase involved in cell wall biosynthesis